MRRLSFLKRHRAFLALFLAAAALIAPFCGHPVLASLGDDSASYLTLARHLSPFGGDALLEPWTRYVVHFPPLFPLLLALTGADGNLLAAHLVVAACALCALALVYAYACRALESRAAGLLVAALFLLAPGAWIPVLGIMSEPLYLALTLAALSWRESVGTDANWKHEAALGLLVSAAVLTRTAGIALVAACAVHVAIAARASRRLEPASVLPVALPLLSLLLWRAVRPEAAHDVYGTFWSAIAARWLHDPQMAAWAWSAFFGGWVSTFTADSSVASLVRIAFGALGALGLAGAAMRAWRNRLDGWYVLASVAMVFAYTFPEAQMRRLLYPLVPLVLVHAAIALRELALRFSPRAAAKMLVAAWAIAAVLTLPATLLVARRALDREPLVPGLPYSAASTSDYYGTLDGALALSAAKLNVVTLAGLELAGRATPAGARIMWTRPEYVGLLSRREGIAQSTRWDGPALARALLESRTDFLVAARLYKSDVDGISADAYTPLMTATPAYLHPVFSLAGPRGPGDFVLFAVDRAALERHVAGAS